MHGLTLVNAIRENPDIFPNLCKININLYDSKDRCSQDEDVTFVEDLFINNTNERIRFVEFLTHLEKEMTAVSMDVKITESHVVLFYHSSAPKIFSRNEYIDYI